MLFSTNARSNAQVQTCLNLGYIKYDVGVSCHLIKIENTRQNEQTFGKNRMSSHNSLKIYFKEVSECNQPEKDLNLCSNREQTLGLDGKAVQRKLPVRPNASST